MGYAGKEKEKGKGKGKGKRRGKGKGKWKEVVNEGSGRGGDGGEDFFLPSSSDGLVEVVFVERSLRFFKVVDSANQVIPVTFLNDVLVESFATWHQHFPGLEVEHLIARAVPKISSLE